MEYLQQELIKLTCPSEKGRMRIMSLTEKQLKYEIANKRRILAIYNNDEGDVLSGRVNVIDS